jgi:hypothetical protein
MRRLLAILVLALVPAVAHGQGLYHLGFTLDGEVGPGWQTTPLGVISDQQVLEWRLTLRGLLRAEAPAVGRWIATLVEP